jgi:phosphatidylglycerol:prolipoprotein diacylglycerol transferase
MLPELFEIGPVTIHSFGFMLAVAFLLIAWLAAKEFVRRGYTSDDAWTSVFAAMVGGVVGAKVYFLVEHLGETLRDPAGMIFSGSGLTYYGGLLGGALAMILVARRRGIPVIVLADMGAPLIALGLGVGRIGCLLNGDDYGRPSDLPWAMAFPKGSPPTEVPVHPTQLYESAASLLFFAGLWAARKRLAARPGLTMGIYLLLAGTERFLVEFLRLNDPVLLGLTLAQWISLALLGIGIVLIGASRSR